MVVTFLCYSFPFKNHVLIFQYAYQQTGVHELISFASPIRYYYPNYSTPLTNHVIVLQQIDVKEIISPRPPFSKKNLFQLTRYITLSLSIFHLPTIEQYELDTSYFNWWGLLYALCFLSFSRRIRDNGLFFLTIKSLSTDKEHHLLVTHCEILIGHNGNAVVFSPLIRCFPILSDIL